MLRQYIGHVAAFMMHQLIAKNTGYIEYVLINLCNKDSKKLEKKSKKGTKEEDLYLLCKE